MVGFCIVGMPEVRRGGMAALRKPPPVRPRRMNGPHNFICNIKFLIAILKLIYACPDTNAFIIIGRFFSSQAWHLCHAHHERNPDNSPTLIMLIIPITKIIVQTFSSLRKYVTPKGVQGIGGKNSFYKYFIPNGI